MLGRLASRPLWICSLGEHYPGEGTQYSSLAFQGGKTPKLTREVTLSEQEATINRGLGNNYPKHMELNVNYKPSLHNLKHALEEQIPRLEMVQK